MIRCSARWRVLQRSLRHGSVAYKHFPRVTPHLPHLRYASLTPIRDKGAYNHRADHRTSDGELYTGARGERDIKSWIDLIDRGLPPHLRPKHLDSSVATLTPNEIAKILLEAQGPVTDVPQGRDVLFFLGSAHKRWDVVIWLVKQLVEGFASAARQAVPSQVSLPWPHDNRLEDLTRGAIEFDASPRSSRSDPLLAGSLTLDQLTGDGTPEARSDENLARDVLGQIWRSLGAMVVACADKGVEPEILEIIAHLHHHEIMPKSIYNQKPHAEPSPIQQPPNLHLLSSRILTSLSDAAWRAHEKFVAAEAKSKGGAYASLRPEIPGMAYRVRVAGVRPEVWLELILWSCLHGGWFLEGAAILRKLCRQGGNRKWRPLSWRTAMPSDYDGAPDWAALSTLLSTKTASNMDEAEGVVTNVQRTISSEVINAYVDAVLSGLDVGVSDGGAQPEYVLDLLLHFREFLKRSNLTLGGGSWDAVISRFLDSQGSSVAQSSIAPKLERLSPRFGAELDAGNVKELPSYVLDGSAAMLTLFHRNLAHYVKAGNIKVAFDILRRLQDYTDNNKRQSLEDFFQTIRSAEAQATLSSGELFSSNYKIDYPGFHVLLPTTILAPLMELVTDTKAYNLGRWLLSSEDIDGVLIPEHLYSDPIMLPALVRFATETNDQALLGKLVDVRAQHNRDNMQRPMLSSNVLQSFLDAQIRLQRWSAVRRILEYMRDTPGMGWNVGHVALLARIILSLQKKSSHMNQVGHAETAAPLGILSCILAGDFDSRADRVPDVLQKTDTLMIVLSTVDDQWADFCFGRERERRYYEFRLHIRHFNWILEGVADSRGSGAARSLLETFWPQADHSRTSAADADVSRKTSARHGSALESGTKQRKAIQLSGEYPRRLVLLGGVAPDLSTIRIILRSALREVKQQWSVQGKNEHAASDAPTWTNAAIDFNGGSKDGVSDFEGPDELAPSATVIWAMKHLRGFGMAREDVRAELSETLADDAFLDLQHRLSDMFNEAEAPRFARSKDIDPGLSADYVGDDADYAPYKPV